VSEDAKECGSLLPPAAERDPVHVTVRLVRYMWRITRDATVLVFDTENSVLLQRSPAKYGPACERGSSEAESTERRRTPRWKDARR
jgi:hypothetical protein